jgi:putative ABC transport system permease protein
MQARRRGLDADVAEEVSYHFERLEAEGQAHGLDPERARQVARERFGDPGIVCAQTHDALRFAPLEGLRHDVRYAWRRLFLVRERLAFAAMVATLALAIGSTAAIFSVFDAVIIRPLPYPSPDQLVVVWQQDRRDRSWFTVAPANFLDWQARSDLFEGLAAVQQFHDTEFSLSTHAAPVSIRGVRVSPELFRVLGVEPALGRAFTDADAAQGSDNVSILSHQLWKARFGADPDIVGRAVRLNGRSVTVVGVMPERFEVPLVPAQIYRPLAWTPAQRTERRVANYLVLGRLRQGVTLTQSAAALDGLARTLESRYPTTNKDTGVLIEPLRDRVVGDFAQLLWMVFAAASAMLLLACFNVANMMSTRGLQRRRELAVRAALGASRWRLVRESVTEGSIIAALGGAAGLLWSNWGVRVFVGLFSDTRFFSLPRRGEIAFDWRVFTFVGIVCAVAAVLFSAMPALHATRPDGAFALKRGDGRRESRFRRVLLVAELAGSLMLVVASLLLGRSYVNLHKESTGFSAARLLTAKVALPGERYQSPARQGEFFKTIVADAGRLPGVTVAGAVSLLPLNGAGSVWPVHVADRLEGLPAPFHFIVTPGYFEAMEIPLLNGRVFGAQDTARGPRVAVLSRTAAALYFPGQDPIGRPIRIEDRDHADWQIVGVVEDVRSHRLDRAPRPQVYVPAEQSPIGTMTVVVRSAVGVPRNLIRPLQEVVRRVDGDQALADVKTMADVVDDSAARWRVSTLLFIGFAAVAIVLAATGLFSVTSFTVAERTREIAIRRALGDSPVGIVFLVVRPLAGVIALGTALGLGLTLMIGRALSSLLYRVEPVDAAMFSLAVLGFSAVILLTGVTSAAKALRIDPRIAMQTD